MYVLDFTKKRMMKNYLLGFRYTYFNVIVLVRYLNVFLNTTYKNVHFGLIYYSTILYFLIIIMNHLTLFSTRWQ